MKEVVKVVFEPLATSKAQIRAILGPSPPGTGHPFNDAGTRLMLYRTKHGIEEIDISEHAENYFHDTLDLSVISERLQERMKLFQPQLARFIDEYHVEQIPCSTFSVPIITGGIAILAISQMSPSYFDLCLADSSFRTSCYNARHTFKGIKHSGDHTENNHLLQHFTTMSAASICEKTPYAVVVSGYKNNKLVKWKHNNPTVMVVNHAEKLLYIVPVPLDIASIGDAILCSPLVIKRSGDHLVCSVLPKPTTDNARHMCSSNYMKSACFQAAIHQADFKSRVTEDSMPRIDANLEQPAIQQIDVEVSCEPLSHLNRNVVFATTSVSIPKVVDKEDNEVVRFGTGLDWQSNIQEEEFATMDLCRATSKETPSTVTTSLVPQSDFVLPCILGCRIEGPLILSVGTAPVQFPFSTQDAYHAYLRDTTSAVVLVDDAMTDNARQLAPSWRINAVFVVQLRDKIAVPAANIEALLNSTNINAISALAGPQSLILIQIVENFYYYRGLANPLHLDTSCLQFGADITTTVTNGGLRNLLDPRVPRLIDLSAPKMLFLPRLNSMTLLEDLTQNFEALTLDDFGYLKEDICALITQLEALQSQKELQDLSASLIAILSHKVHSALAPIREEYFNVMQSIREAGHAASPPLLKHKQQLLGKLRKTGKSVQAELAFAIERLSTMVTSRATSRRTHDLKRLLRQTTIQKNIDAVKGMTFASLGTTLETYAEDMGVLLVNVKTAVFEELLEIPGYRHYLAGNRASSITSPVHEACHLDSRTLHLPGLDAGIVLEQSYVAHGGSLDFKGSARPRLAMSSLTSRTRDSLMLAWVCWDEFVGLRNPFTVRWMEKCNEPHISACRIIMLETLCGGLVSRSSRSNPSPNSIEIRQLMAALLTCAMKKLAASKSTSSIATRTVSPVSNTENAAATSKVSASTVPTPAIFNSTVCKLMRGLFGNLLTIAGSGIKPLSRIWQLVGSDPRWEIPSTTIAWSWYTDFIELYAHTGWPIARLNINIEKLLDKCILRVITKNELIDKITEVKVEKSIACMASRNAQLMHSHIIVTVFFNMLKNQDSREYDVAIIKRLLAVLSTNKLETQSRGYKEMMKYICLLAGGGQRNVRGDSIIADTHTKRSGHFHDLKCQVAHLLKADARHPDLGVLCRALCASQRDLWKLWGVLPHVQNIEAYRQLLDAVEGKTAWEDPVTSNAIKAIKGDAELVRKPWHLENAETGNDTIPANEDLIRDILNGEVIQDGQMVDVQHTMEIKPRKVRLSDLAGQVNTSFITDIEAAAAVTACSVQERTLKLCKILDIPYCALSVLYKQLCSSYDQDMNADLGRRFKEVVVVLLKNRNRENVRPTAQLFDMEQVKEFTDEAA